MPATKTKLIGGAFQDSEGNVLANGYLEMVLSRDGVVTGVGQVASGIKIRITLDANGDVVTSPAQSVWANSDMSPVNTYYRVTGFTNAGQPVWGPNNQQVVSGATFDVGTWTPNQVISWVPPLQPLDLLTNAVENPDQARLNFEDTSSVTWAIDSNGNLTASSAAALTLETDGVANGDQTLLNLKAGTNVNLTDNGSGQVTIDATGVNLEVNGTPNGDQTLLNLKNGNNITISDDGVGGVTIAQTASSLRSISVTLTPSQLHSLHTTPVQLIAAPGAGFMIVPFFVVANYVFNTTPYSSSGEIDLIYGTTLAVYPQAVITSSGSAGGFMTSSQSRVTVVTLYAPASTQIMGFDVANSANKALNASNSAAAFSALGDGSVVLTIFYQIVAVS